MNANHRKADDAYEAACLAYDMRPSSANRAAMEDAASALQLAKLAARCAWF
jgi:hypothetical protein